MTTAGALQLAEAAGYTYDPKKGYVLGKLSTRSGLAVRLTQWLFEGRAQRALL